MATKSYAPGRDQDRGAPSTPDGPSSWAEGLSARADHRFDGRCAIVTGGTRGIGRAVAEGLLAEGARVAVADVDEEWLDQAHQELGPRYPARMLACRCDVTRGEEVAELVSGAVEAWGRIDVLVNNAGRCTFGRLVDLSEEDWDSVMDVNAKGTFLCSRAVLPHMLEAERGAIVSIASQAGRQGERLIAHYCAAKAAVINLTRAMALEVAPAVRVNAVCPGVVETGMIQGELDWRARHLGEDPQTTRAEWRTDIPMERFQRPEHIAHAVLFLASDEASEITGQAISVDGGTVMV